MKRLAARGTALWRAVARWHAKRSDREQRMLMALRLVIAFGLVTIVASRVRLGELADVSWWQVVAATITLAASYTFAALKWRLHVSETLVMPRRRAVRLYFLGLFWNNFLPTSAGGDVVRGWRAAAGVDGAIVASYSSVIADRLTSALVMFGIGSIAVVATDIRLPPAITVVMVSALLLCMLVLAVLVRVNRHLAVLRSPRRMAAAFGFALIVQGLQLAVNSLVLLGVTGHLDVGLLAVVIPISAAASMLPISLNGLGIREGTAAGLMTYAGVSAHDASATVLVVLAITILVSLPGGLSSPQLRHPIQHFRTALRAPLRLVSRRVPR